MTRHGELRPLLYPCRPWSDESVLGSFQLRLRQNNGIGSLAHFDSLLGRERSTTPVRFLTEPDVPRLLGQLADLDFDLSDDMPRVLESAATGKSNCSVLRWRGGELSLQFWMHGRAQVCPVCLRTKGYLDYSLDYWHVPVCVDHRCVLVDACPACQAPLSVDRPALFHCGSCGHDLSKDEPQPVTKRAADFAGSLASLQRFELVATEGSASLEPSQMAALIAHLGCGEHIESLADQLPAAAVRLSAGERFAALVALADCGRGNRVEAQLLKEAIIRRNRYLAPFKRTPFFDWWLQDGLNRTDLGIRASNALRHGRADDVSHLAAHQSRHQQLRARSPSEARKLLKLSVYELDELSRWTPLRKSRGALGYDAEQLVQAMTFHRACIDENDLDACFGLAGLTQHLLSHGKLQAFAPRASLAQRVTPGSLDGLLSGLEHRVPRHTESDNAAPLVEILAGHDEPARAAVSLLLGSDPSTLVGWRPPFRLADILCARGAVPRRTGGDLVREALPPRLPERSSPTSFPLVP